MTRQTGTWVIAAASLLCGVLGSVHAFSVFLVPLETQSGAQRSEVSLTYSLALVAITAMVLVGPRFYGRVPPWLLMLAAGAIAAAGALLAGEARSIEQVWGGYSLLFGVANGVGYGFGLQIAGRANPGREGLAMGVVTAAYALGATLSPLAFEAAVGAGGFALAMRGLAIALMVAGLLSGVVLRRTGIRFEARIAGAAPLRQSQADLACLWAAYGAGVLAGLMSLGHAAEIAGEAAAGLEGWIAPALMATCNMGGSLSGGHLADRVWPFRLLAALPALAVLVLPVMALVPTGAVVLAGLSVVGFSYGAIISVYPAVILKRCGPQNGPVVYGRVFTAWGFAGLAGPWLAGAIFDASGGYAAALLVAAALAAASTGLALRVLPGILEPPSAA